MDSLKTRRNGFPRPEGMLAGNGLLNSYAMVVYLTGGIGEFVNDLRRELVPGCTHRAHLTILPPRPLSSSPAEAIEYCNAIANKRDVFFVRPNEVDLFESTQVIKLSIGRGCSQLVSLHKSLNSGPMRFQEPFAYTPHITLAQELPPQRVAECLRIARERWASFRPRSPVSIETMTFVQQNCQECWHDVAQLSLRQLEPVGVVGGRRPPAAEAHK